jgi:hypothetical protein
MVENNFSVGKQNEFVIHFIERLSEIQWHFTSLLCIHYFCLFEQK